MNSSELLISKSANAFIYLVIVDVVHLFFAVDKVRLCHPQSSKAVRYPIMPDYQKDRLISVYSKTIGAQIAQNQPSYSCRNPGDMLGICGVYHIRLILSQIIQGLGSASLRGEG